MKRLCLLLLTSCLFLMIPARSQSVVRGHVTDRATREPLEYAVVTLVRAGQPAAGRGGLSAVTDVQGNFSIVVANPGDSLAVSFIGYRRVCVCGSAGTASGGALGAAAPCAAAACCADGSCKDRIEIVMERQTTDLKAVTIIPCPNGMSQSIGRIDLSLRPANSAQDLMRLVPGLFIGEHQGGGLAEHIFFRGFDADHGTDVNVSVDGMPLNLVSHIHGQGFADLHFLIPELVSKIDYGKGPFYAEYGDFTTAGYVALRTADVLDHSEVKVEGGQYRSGRVMAKVNLLSGAALERGESAYLAVEAGYTDGPFVWAQHLRRLNLYGKYNLRLSGRTKLIATLTSYQGAWRSSGEIPERAVREGLIGRFGYLDSAQGGLTGRTNMIVRLRSDLGKNLALENQAYFSTYYFTLHYDPTFFADDSVNGDQLRQQETRRLAGYNGRLTHHLWWSGSDLSSAVGIGAQANWFGSSSLEHTKNGNEVLAEIQAGVPREYTANAYLDINYRYGKWLLNMGARLDGLKFSYRDAVNASQPSRARGVFSPKISLCYNWNGQVQFYAKAGKGFHSNDVRAVIGNRGLDVLPAAYGTDLGVNVKPVAGLFVNAAIWTLYLQQEFTYDGDEGTMSPGNATLRKGIDLSARYQLTGWLFAHLDLNICKARDLAAMKGENYLPLAVPLSSTGSLEFKRRSGWNGSISYRYMKNRPANSDNSLMAQGYFVMDALVNYTRSRWEIGLDIQNLLNTDWRETQFETMSKMRGERAAVDGISYTPGVPFEARVRVGVFL